MGESKPFSMIIVKRSILRSFLVACQLMIPVKNFAIDKDTMNFDKAEIGNLMSNFINTKYDNVRSVREYFLRILRVVTRIK